MVLEGGCFLEALHALLVAAPQPLKEYDKENIARGVPLSKFLRRVMQVRNTEEERSNDAAAHG